MIFDPKTALDDCDTLMLDMDGTVLDLAYDNYMWLEHMPEHYAARHGISAAEAREDLQARFHAAQGDLAWYCLDHWSELLDLDVLALHRDQHHRIGYLPGAREFLERARAHHVRVLMVTNSHPATLALKQEVTGLCEYFDGIHSSHSYGFAKERQEFWRALRTATDFDPARTMFVDDSRPVLQSASRYGVGHVVEVAWPDTSRPARDSSDFVAVEGVAELL